eukprot:scaffold1911_cov397-Prasinococcus_capsulatus_cf.AAC.6
MSCQACSRPSSPFRARGEFSWTRPQRRLTKTGHGGPGSAVGGLEMRCRHARAERRGGMRAGEGTCT